MFRTRIIMLAALYCLALVSGVFGQARDFDPPTPKEDLENIAGTKPGGRDVETDQFRPRGGNNPHEQGDDEKWVFRSPFVVRDQDGQPIEIQPPSYAPGGAYTLVADLDQYMLDFEFETPRWILVTAPDGTPKVYWYMIYRAINWDTFPLRAHLSFEAKTMAQDLAPEPQMTAEQIEEQKRELLRQFVGKDGDNGSQQRYEEYADELARGIRNSLTHHYINYPDRALMDAICNKERRWEEDGHGRLYNSLVPAHLFQWRKRLLVNDDYQYPEMLLLDYQIPQGGGRVQANAFIVKRTWTGADTEPNITVIKVAGTGDAAPTVLADNVGLSSFLNGTGTNTTLHMLSESAFMPDNRDDKNKLPLVPISLSEAITRYTPMYQKGDRVDAYGFRLREGHPDYERGVMINSDFTIATHLYGATLQPIDTNDGPYKGMQDLPPGTIEVPHDEPADMYRLPEMGGTKLISPPVESMVRIATTLNTLFEVKDPKAEPLADEFKNLVAPIHKASIDGVTNLEQYRRDMIQLVSKLLPKFESDSGRDENSRELPDVVFYDIEQLVVRQSRLTFAEAHGQSASLLGRSSGGYLWDAMYHPAQCYVKSPAARRYKDGDNVLRNYHLPAETVWGVAGDPDHGKQVNRPIGEEEVRDPKRFVTGQILDAYEFGHRGLDETILPAPENNRFGGENGRNSDSAAVEVSNGQAPWFDATWNRDNGEGRPVKRQDHFGRSMADGQRYYRPGDRVTPMEWEAYAAMTPVNILREYANANPKGYEPERKFLRYGDLLVGQPRLILGHFKYEEIDNLGERGQQPKAQFINGHVPGHKEVMVAGDGTLWRFGFECDAAGDYDAIIYEELPSGSRGKFDQWVDNAWREIKARRSALSAARTAIDEALHKQKLSIREARAAGAQASAGVYNMDEFIGLDYLMPVPVFGREGAREHFVNPVTNERIPMRVGINPPVDQPVEFVRDEGGNVTYAIAYEKLPRYIYEYDYLAISASEADENKQERDGAEFAVQRFEDDARKAGAERRPPPNVESYWSNERPRAENTDQMEGLFKVDDRPTLQAAEIVDRSDEEFNILVDRQHIKKLIRKNPDDQLNPDRQQYDALVVTSNRHAARIIREEENGRYKRYIVQRNDTWRHPNVVYLGEVVDESRTRELVFKVVREIRPAVAEGVAVFGELDQQWDFMNVYVSGIKGSVRRDGLNAVPYQTVPNNGQGDTTRLEFSPQLREENWVLMLRFTRPGDEFATTNDQVTIGRQFWYLEKENDSVRLRGE